MKTGTFWSFVRSKIKNTSNRTVDVGSLTTIKKQQQQQKDEEKKNALVATMFRWLSRLSVNYAVEESILSCRVVIQMEFPTILIFALIGCFLIDYFPPFTIKRVGCVKIILTFESICCSVKQLLFPKLLKSSCFLTIVRRHKRQMTQHWDKNTMNEGQKRRNLT